MQAKITPWLLASLLFFGLLATRPAALAEVRHTAPQQQAFSSGAMRSEALLREISATLKSIDRRLAKIERSTDAIVARPNGVGHVR